MEEQTMEKKDLDWGNIGFSYMPTDKRYVANYKDGAWDEGGMTSDPNVVINECSKASISRPSRAMPMTPNTLSPVRTAR